MLCVGRRTGLRGAPKYFAYSLRGAPKYKDRPCKSSKHSDEKPFACPIESCEFRSKLKGSLFVHLKSHSNERPYTGELCSFRAKIRQTVRSHLKTVHNDL